MTLTRVILSAACAALACAPVVAGEYAPVGLTAFTKPQVLLFAPDCTASTGVRRAFTAEEMARFQNVGKEAGQTCVRFDLDGQTFYVKPSSVETTDRGTVAGSMCGDAIASAPGDRRDAGSMGQGDNTGKRCATKP
ncbi:MAG TPA: hypothetical protein DCL54_14945 [Alphaproteobacteria bacterium]|nr:hypothetical protein [Alphaproteobacteria bacterium]HAJ47869.1 hypothetical protein [Alphaproteobacteria bacterium]